MTFIDGGASATWPAWTTLAAGAIGTWTATPLAPADSDRVPTTQPWLVVAVSTTSGGPSSVQFDVATDAVFANIVWSQTYTLIPDGRLTAHVGVGLTNLATHYWRARAGNGAGSWGAYSTTRRVIPDPNAGRAYGYVETNAGVGYIIPEPDVTSVVFIDENIGVELHVEPDVTSVGYIDLNQGVEITRTSLAFQYAEEGDVNALTPTPHIWWLIPTAGRSGDGISVFGFGFGDLPGTYGGVLEINMGGSIGWTALGAITWQTFPANSHGYDSLRHMDTNLGEVDMQHQVIECVVPMDAIPPGYPLRVRTEGGA